jgi:hypothetical protein
VRRVGHQLAPGLRARLQRREHPVQRSPLSCASSPILKNRAFCIPSLLTPGIEQSDPRSRTGG